MRRGRVQTQAISELLALPANYPFKRHTLEHLAVLQINLQSRQNRSKDKRELAMNLTPVYQQWREETLQEGRQEMLLVTVPLLLQTGMTIEQIAKQFNVDVEAMHQAAQENS
jgi:predicted transposase YdaD